MPSQTTLSLLHNEAKKRVFSFESTLSDEKQCGGYEPYWFSDGMLQNIDNNCLWILYFGKGVQQLPWKAAS